ncbi:MAG: YetF domain-containing protein [Parvularcula sp.]|jgi:uncharacterized membrane protein YcaP (DUF421 family)|nr:YetF domain-containing protein [Parvularcula sp.]
MEQTNDIIGWFGGWDRLRNVAIGAVFFYAYIVLLVRLLGKRTTGQMNNFDWIITIAVGSLAASGILLKSVAITEAAAAIAILSAAQWLTTKLVLKSDIVAGIVKDEPTLLTSKGEFLREGMKKTRVSEEEVMSALRANGMTSLDDANWVILETNGEFSVIPKDDAELDELPALSNVNRPGG